jgi:5'-3' exonuclease
MGIEYFFSGLLTNKQIKTADGIIKGIDLQTSNNFIYIDFNSILYMMATKIENEINYNIYESIINNTIDKNMKYDNDMLNNKLIEYVKNCVLNICTNVNNPEDIKTIYIGIDGIPTISKIIEQRNRYYKKYFTQQITKKFTELDKNELSANRIKYESCKLTFDRSVFSADGKIMKDISNILTNSDFIGTLKDKCTNLNECIVSKSDIVGEGEKKIVEHIFENMREGKYIIISPDADIIILSIIMKSRFLENNINGEFCILRLNDTIESQKDYINIDKICDNIYEYVKMKKNWIQKHRILNDISTIFSFLGNDFIPKLECINTKNDIDKLINLYIDNLDSADKYITEYDNIAKKYKINTKNLLIYIFDLEKKEDSYLKNKYLMKNYRNYNFLTKIFIPEYENTYIGLVDYVNKCNKIYEYMENISISTESVLNIARKEGLNKKSFKIAYCKIEGEYKNELNDDMLDFEYISLVKAMSNNIRRKKIEYSPKKLYLHGMNEDVNIEFHLRNIKEHMLHQKMEIEKLDITSYGIEKKIGKFGQILNNDRNIVNIKLDILKTGYKIRTLYNESERIDTDDMITKYLEGIYWVFDYYFNKNNKEYNCNNLSTWFYKYKKAPLLLNIVKYMNNNKTILDDIEKSLNNKYIAFESKNVELRQVTFRNLQKSKGYTREELKTIIIRIIERENMRLEYKYFDECYNSITNDYNLDEYLDLIKTNISDT